MDGKTFERTVKEISPKKMKLFGHKKIKACAYIRVSTSHQGQMNSLQNQKEYYERKLKINPDYEYYGIFSDSGISGAKEERPGFLEMMEKARMGDIDLIITKSISRFARNTVLLLKYVRELKELGMGVLFEEQKINTLKADGELLLTVLGAITEEERKSVSSNIKWAMQNRFKCGRVLVDTNRLLGYDKDENGKLIINKEQAQIVSRICRMYLDGNSAYEIAKVLNSECVPTYSKNVWTHSRISSILSNEKYAGDCLMQKAFVADNGREIINRGQRDKYYIKNNHPPIIKRKDWEKVQIIREDRKTKAYKFTGMLKCPHCGASLIRVVHQKRWVSWICATYMQKGKSACTGMRIPDGKLNEITRDMTLSESVIVEEVIDDQIENRNSKRVSVLYPLPNIRDSGEAKEQRNKKHVAAYCRVSSGSSEQMESYNAQIQYYEKYIKENPDYIFSGIYADEAVSGTDTRKRGAFRQMVQDCRDGKIDTVVTKSLSRFGRNTVDCLKVIRELKALGVDVYFEKENIHTLRSKGEMLISLISAVAQNESLALSENVKWGIHRKYERGLVQSIPCGKFLGYGKDKAGNLEINEEQAAIVRRVFQEFPDGYGTFQIAKRLTEEKIPTAYGGKEWCASHIHKVLTNEKMKGNTLCQKTYTTRII